MSPSVKCNTLTNKTSMKRAPFNKFSHGQRVIYGFWFWEVAKAIMTTVSKKGLLWGQGLDLAERQVCLPYA